MNGFYVPGSKSGSYVASKRTDEGTLQYQGAASEIGIQKQAALQDLSKNYSAAIENAYASYLANQNAIAASTMGEGYKEAYQQAAQQNLISNIAETNLSAAKTRAELESEETKELSSLQKQYTTEVANIDRLANSMSDYLDYINTLTDKQGTGGYLTEEQKTLGIDDLYETLYSAQPQGMFDPEGKAGKSYMQWIGSRLGSSESDMAWSQWLYGGGWQDFISSVERNKKTPGQLALEKASEPFTPVKATKNEETSAKVKEKGKADVYTDVYTVTDKSGKTAEYKASGTYNPNYKADRYSYHTMESDLRLADKWKTGELKAGDIITYNDEIFVIRQHPANKTTYEVIKLKEIK